MSAAATVDAIALAQALIRCPSVTPEDAGALAVLEAVLKPLGFTCHRLRFESPESAPVENLYARLGDNAPNFCFAGHTDVVPPGDRQLWRHDPFGGDIEGSLLYGRGAADMKSGIAAFVAAVSRYLAKCKPTGSISLLITGDEEGIAVNGTRRVLDWITERGECIDHCIVGEPTATAQSGDIIKIGRRGSMTFRITARGTQGHVAYSQRARNPIPMLARLVTVLSETPLDSGTEHFQPSTLSFTTVDVCNPAANVIPAEAHAQLNIRFNDRHTPQNLQQHIETTAAKIAHEVDGEIAVSAHLSGTAFLTQPGAFTDLLRKTVAEVTGHAPELSTTGGTSDARFIKDHCPVVELGLPGATMHQTDECMPVSEIHRLTDIYTAILDSYFAHPQQ